MKKTPLKRKTKLKRGKVPLRTKNTGKVPSCPNKRKPKTDLKKLKEQLWELCRKIVKLRYPHRCYTCSKQLIDGTSDFHTGHFIPSSVCSVEMRYSLDNLRPQCSSCNVWKSGDWLSYETHLKSDGIDTEALKQKNEATKGMMYDITWYRKKVEEYEFIHSQEKEKRDRGGII